MVKEIEMNLWRAEPLKDYKSVFSRFFFRLIWCLVGGVLTYLVCFYFFQKSLFLFLAAFVIGISILGAVYDIWRLKSKRKSSMA